MLSYIQPKPLSGAALRQLIAKAVEKGWVRETFHSEHERAHRNISDEDILYGLERADWIIVSPPDYDKEHNSWEYLIKTCDLDGVELHLKVVPGPADGTVKVITKF
jgi:hypothetical protein